MAARPPSPSMATCGSCRESTARSARAVEAVRLRAVRAAQPPGRARHHLRASTARGSCGCYDVNGDGEADRYENFSNLIIQIGRVARVSARACRRSRAADSFSRWAARSTTGRRRRRRSCRASAPARCTAAPCMEVSADGRSIRTYASGLREPNIGVASAQRTGRVVGPAGQLRAVHADLSARGRRLLRRHADSAPRVAAARAPAAPLDPARSRPFRRGRGVGDGEQDGLRGRRADPSVVRAPGPVPRLPRQHALGVQGAIIALPGFYTTPTLKGRVHPQRRPAVPGWLPDLELEREGRRRASRDCAARRDRARSRSRCVRDSRESWCASPRRSTRPAAADRSRYQLQSWDYRRTSSYGSGHFKRDGSAGHDRHQL